MFPIDFIQQERGALPVITGNRRDILFEEVPILFTGTNDFGGFIVGSSIDEDYDQGIEWYFHVVVTKEKFLDYTGGNVAYRQLLETSPYVYVLEKYVNTSEEIYYQINFETVPDEYKPLPNSFFPSATRQVKSYGSIAASTSLEMIEYIRQMERVLIETSEYLSSNPKNYVGSGSILHTKMRKVLELED